jgi:hypothetical protein
MLAVGSSRWPKPSIWCAARVICAVPVTSKISS